MLSVCIPVYNQDVRSLVTRLHQQALQLDVACEMVVIDDRSEKVFQDLNRSVCQREHYLELSENIGRSRIRNLFLKHARYDYLLFLDCDATVVNHDFLQKYVNAFKEDNHLKVVCGGWRYGSEKPPRPERLRWKYGTQRETRSVEKRRFQANKSFMSGNFLIRKDILAQYPFDERISEYGHEDTLFGYTLKQNGVVVHHIDNAPVNGGKPESNVEFLHKTELSIGNLGRIVEYVGFDPAFTEDLNLLRVYKKVRKFAVVLKSIYGLSKPLVFFLLIKGYGSIRLFDFYKLGLFLQNTPASIRARIR